MTEKKINIKPADLKKEMESAYLDYSMSVIVSRALPDVRDGLKPVHRRIIYGMQQQGLFPDRKYSKSARLVGDVMGKYHPHGDSAIYDAVVRLAQDFNMRYPLVDGQGNFGSIDGDGAAAPRYTELRMAKLSLEMLRDINKDTVDFQDNYDGEEQEPVVLPSRFPNLIVNGSSGIAVGMATNMAPHNLGETIDALIATIDNPNITIDELMKHIKAPDFPTGANIMGLDEVKKAYKTGRGKVRLRAQARIEEVKNRYKIIVTEIPYQVNKANLIKKIADLVKQKKIEGISDLRDESDRKGMRIVIDIKRDANPNIVLNNLYKNTQMQTTFGIINLALVNGVPKVLTLKQLIEYYLVHQEIVVTRRFQFDLNKAKARLHIVEGLLKAIDNIDEIIHIIRTSYDDAQEKLMAKFGFSEIQAQAILDMRLKRLQGLEKEKLQDEFDELTATIKKIIEILNNRKLLLNIIKEELTEIKTKYSDDRRTKILRETSEFQDEELMEEEDMFITITNKGYIKRISTDAYKVQHRGGKGVNAMGMKDGDFIKDMFSTTTHQDLLFFTNTGKVYSLKAYEVPEAGRSARGSNIINLIQIDANERVTQVLALDKDKENDQFIVFMTKKGKVKKTSLTLYENIRKTGIIAIKFDEEDELIDVKLVEKNENLIIVTKNGMSLRFNVDQLRDLSRNAIGVKAITLNKDDEVISFEVVQDNEYLAVISENGYGKKTELSSYTLQNRGGKGIRTYKIAKKTGLVACAKALKDEDEILLISKQAEVIRIKASAISTLSRATSGVLLKNTDKGEDAIVAVAKYFEE
ncbi:DNA gyrase subunit A [uncultured Finegoldia sp.]|uniref:DNA gyrase subunit A n=1 Tax=uncultured Finegoldia sp. TaxID=328009 RepID=UPI002607816D|nr:DNA gyrase subunit A [uncultured Finegoldia sp.]